MEDEGKDLLKHIDTDGESANEDERRARGRSPYLVNNDRSRRINTKKIPLGMWLIEATGLLNLKPLLSHKAIILILTFFCYTSYHLSRKPFSVVKVVLCPECANCSYAIVHNTSGWPPFNDITTGKALLGVVDYSWLFAYAIAMFISGQIADRVNLRYFLFIGMTGSGISVALLGVAYFANIHSLWYFIVVQVFGGVMQSTGWPGTVAVMGNWFGKHNRGLILGIWNSHTSVGNILGTIIPSFWADCDGDSDQWGWSFILPAAIITCVGVILFFFLITDPRHVGLPSPKHHLESDNSDAQTESVQSNGTYRVTQPDPDLDANNKGYQSDDAKLNDEKKFLDTNDLLTQTSSHNASVQQNAITENPQARTKSKAVNIFRAFLIPGVIEFALALFFDKLVSYTFLYWLPFYVKYTFTELSGPESDWLSTLFDVGGILGGITAGLISDQLNARAIVCVVMLLLAVPSLFVLEAFSDSSIGFFITMLIVSGMFVNGPYSMITTAVSSDLGTHRSLQGNQNAKATVTAIIDGTGSLGAAFGPLIIGWFTTEFGWMNAFYFLMACCVMSALLLGRLVVKDVISMFDRISNAWMARRSRSEYGVVS